MKENQKGYKVQGDHRKDPYKVSRKKEMDSFLKGISSESGPYQLDKMFKEDMKGYKAQNVHKKHRKRSKKVGGGSDKWWNKYY